MWQGLDPIKMDDLGVPLFLETPMFDQRSMMSLGDCSCRTCSVNALKAYTSRGLWLVFVSQSIVW